MNWVNSDGSRRIPIVLGLTLSALGLVVTAAPARATTVETAGPSRATSDCSALVGRVFGNAKVTDAELVAAQGSHPAMCVVHAQHIERAHLKMEAYLPANWDGSSVHVGGGGLDGSLPGGKLYWSSYLPADRGAAVIGSNGGHESDKPMAAGDGAPLEGNREARIDYAYRAVSETDLFGKALIRTYYRRDPRFRYFAGCSKGGYDALQAAARFPQNYDGVLAQAPAPNIDSFVARIASYSILPDVSDATWRRVFTSYIAACDGLDGLRDGIVSNIAACKFELSSVPGLTSAELATIQSVTSDLALPDGTVVNGKYGWGLQTGIYPAMATLGQEWTRHLIFGPGYDPKTFNLQRDWPLIQKANAPYSMNVPSAKVASFARAGKKLMIATGTEDATESLKDNLAYYENVRKQAGPSAANVRMFLAPGVNHCGYAVGGPASIDMLGALRAWVEKGREPSDMVASGTNQSKAAISRPVCEVGSYPRYDGKGDPNSAASFRCTPNAVR